MLSEGRPEVSEEEAGPGLGALGGWLEECAAATQDRRQKDVEADMEQKRVFSPLSGVWPGLEGER